MPAPNMSPKMVGAGGDQHQPALPRYPAYPLKQNPTRPDIQAIVSKNHAATTRHPLKRIP